LEATGVAVTPGIDFGKGAEGFLRFSYANSEENIERAIDRLGFYLKNS
jgi:aspartate/methionine/tyrosine aminotransferase